MGDNLESKFEAFASQSLQNHAQVLGVMHIHGEQLKDVKVKLDEHLYNHLRDLQKDLENEKLKSSKNAEIWIGSLIGVVGVVIAAWTLAKH